MTTQATAMTNPYIGPRTFTYAQRHLFFGREREARDLLARMLSERLLLFYAQSGAGKSSLLHTRLIPQLQEEKGFVVLPVARVSGELLAGVAQVDNIYTFNLMLSIDEGDEPARLAQVTLSDFFERLTQRTLVDSKGEEHKGWVYDATQTPVPATVGPNVRRYALIVDQFEEIITGFPEHWRERAAFFRQIDQAMRSDPNLWVVFTLREDYVASLDPYAPLLADRLRARFYMERMGVEAALAAIKQPAVLAGHPFAEGVAPALVDNLRRIKVIGQTEEQLGQYVEPVQLQVVCYQLWEKALAAESTFSTEITMSDLQNSGDVDTALADFYEQAIATALAVPDVMLSERQLRSWFDEQLITAANTRGTVYRGVRETGGMSNHVVDALQARFLLHSEVRAGGTWVELVHDRFVEPIQHANADWRSRYHNPLDKAHVRWREGGGQDDRLLAGNDLEKAERFALQHPLEMTAEEMAFLQRSSTYAAERARRQAERIEFEREREEARQRELEQQRQLTAMARQRAVESEANASRQHREAQRLRWLSVGLLIVTLVAAFITWIAVVQRNLAVARGLVTEARHQLEVRDLRLATLLALEAKSLNPTEAEQLLTYDIPSHSSFYISKVEHLRDYERTVTSVAWSPDGRTLASASDDATIRLWDVTSGKNVQTLSGHVSGVTSVAWSPDGHTLASASDDATIKLWDVASGENVQTLSGHVYSVTSVAWSPDGRTLVSASDDATIKLWDVASGENVQTLSGHVSGVTSVAWSPDGHTLASASDDTTIKLWDAISGENVQTLPGHVSGVTSVAWSPDGHTLASASDDATIKLWDAASGENVQTFSGHTNRATSVAWSPDGRTLASSSWDTTIKLWDVASGKNILTLSGHANRVTSVVWSHDGRTLASASDDNMVKLWDVALGENVLTLPGHTNDVTSVAWSPDGRTLASASDDTTIKLWDATSGENILTLSGHANRVTSVAWSPDGRTLASSSWDTIIKLWDVASGKNILILPGHTNDVTSVVWSHDGRTLASASNDTTIKLWPVQGIPDPCLLVYENFSLAEWVHYRPSTIYHLLCPDRPAPPLPGILDALNAGDLNLLLITWPGRIFVANLGLVGALIIGFLLWWFFKLLGSRPHLIGFIGLWLY